MRSPISVTNSAVPTSTRTAAQSVKRLAKASARTIALVATEKLMLKVMVRLDAMDSRWRAAIIRRSLVNSATSPASRAAAAPATPMAMPTVAAARAGASLTPSPM